MQYIFPVQILSTIKSIIRLKISCQMNWHFSTAFYIFQHTHPYRIIDNIFSKFFSTTFTATHFSTSIKCIQYSLLLIENYSQVIFYKIRQHSTSFDTISIVYCIHQDYSPQNVSWCRSLGDFVEFLLTSFFPSLSLYPYIWKLFKESFDKCRQNPHNLL